MPSAGATDQMVPSTVFSPDRQTMVSSDEEEDIYCHTILARAPGEEALCQIEKKADGHKDQEAQEIDRQKPDQVRREEAEPSLVQQRGLVSSLCPLSYQKAGWGTQDQDVEY